ncbi:ABC transporter substrate-binding protein [Arthrobacter zhaoxinii]|uniref:ABC transporter substrate-binding protein n=1 Tax=Arthrobacter zhaoxinii TaxID=2964616 RepID=UPI0021037560|nr:extracellular solute-binding protein [Arthrobacter zhaoxinii]MCQ2000564.1 extracellular solute-binding protein [Arthrobacter zhaoxinii]
MTSSSARKARTLGVGLVALSLLLTACAGSGPEAETAAADVSQEEIDAAMAEETTLNFWTWVPDIEDEVALFEEQYPNIDVQVENVGQGPDHYTKVRAALSAGQGAPDVIQVEYPYVPSFQLTEDLLDLTPYVEENLQDNFPDWVWNQVNRNDQLLAFPQDTGPMGNLYREDILTEAGLSESPATWDEFAEAAVTVKETTGSYITDLPPNDAGVFIALLWQAGVKPFSYTGGEEVGIDLDSDRAKEVAVYWENLIKDDVVAVDPNFTDSWYQGLSNGKYAGWLTAAWGPVFLQGTAGDTAGLWRAAPLPQYEAGEEVSSNLGGSANAVLKSSENPIAAAKLAEFLNTDKASTELFNSQQSLFPAYAPLLEDEAFLSTQSEFYGGQEVNALFADVSETVDSTFEWLPFQEFVTSSFNDTLGKAIADKGDLSAGLTAWENELKDYATNQGFTVK